MAEPLDAVEARELAELLGRERSRILPVAISGKEQFERRPALGEEREGLDQRQHALVGEHASDIGGGDGGRRLGQRRQMIGIDAGARNEHHGLGGRAKRDDESAIVGVLDNGAASLAAEKTGQSKPHGLSRRLLYVRLANKERAQPSHAVDNGGRG